MFTAFLLLEFLLIKEGKAWGLTHIELPEIVIQMM
jgi:hypothetical protein